VAQKNGIGYTSISYTIQYYYTVASTSSAKTAVFVKVGRDYEVIVMINVRSEVSIGGRYPWAKAPDL